MSIKESLEKAKARIIEVNASDAGLAEINQALAELQQPEGQQCSLCQGSGIMPGYHDVSDLYEKPEQPIPLFPTNTVNTPEPKFDETEHLLSEEPLRTSKQPEPTIYVPSEQEKADMEAIGSLLKENKDQAAENKRLLQDNTTQYQRAKEFLHEATKAKEALNICRKNLVEAVEEDKRLKEIIIDTITHCTGQCDVCHNRLDLALTDEDRENAFRKKQALQEKSE